MERTDSQRFAIHTGDIVVGCDRTVPRHAVRFNGSYRMDCHQTFLDWHETHCARNVNIDFAFRGPRNAYRNGIQLTSMHLRYVISLSIHQSN